MSMGFFWDNDDNYEDISDYDVGVIILTKLYDELVDYWGRSVFVYTKDEFISYYANLKGGQIQGLGLGIKMAELSPSVIDESLKKVVIKSNGRIPKSIQPLISVLSQVAADRWMDTYSSDILTSTVDDFAKLSGRLTEAATQITEGVGWSSKLIMPATIVVGLAAILFFGKPYIKAAQKAFAKR
jgi:hypothetical protein